MLHATVRGVVAAMSMSGLRTLTVRFGLMGRTPPEMIVDRHAEGWLQRVPPERREAVVELLHWVYGGGGGAMFGALPARIRLQPWAGPVYGALLWLAFELVLEPALGLQRHRRRGVAERVALTADHLLFGAVLAELRRRPQH